MNVPSTHDPNNNPPNNKEGTMPNNPITENNPFPVQQKGEPMKLTIKMDNGTLQEFNLWFAGRSPSEMSSMELVKAVFDAVTLQEKIDDHDYNAPRVRLAQAAGIKLGIEVNEMFVVDRHFDACRAAIKTFLNEAAQINWDKAGEMNFHPQYAKSFRAWGDTKSKSAWRDYSDTRRSIIMEEVLMEEMSFKNSDVIVTEDENGELIYDIPGNKYGYVVRFKTYVCNSKGQHYVRDWKGALYLNKTANGYRLLWKNKKTGHAQFGATYKAMRQQKLVSSNTSVEYILINMISETLKPEDILPILKWIDVDTQEQGVLTHPYGISGSDIYWIGSETSVKKILNKAYKHHHGVTKKAFGDINGIKTLTQLRSVLALLKTVREFNPQVLEKLNIDLVTAAFKYDTTNTSKNLEKFFKFFGHRDRFLLEMFAEEHEDADFASYNIPVHQANDTTRTLAMIKSRRHRLAIKTHVANAKLNIEEIHDYVVAEAEKVRHENRTLKKNAVMNKYLPYNNKEIAPGITMVVPTQTHDLIEWGATQNNCIGSYVHMVERGDCIIVGFKDGYGNWLGHAEISSSMRLNQLLGKHNRPLPAQDRDLIVKFLEDELGVATTYYWGSEDAL